MATTSPVDSLTEDIDLLIASIGLLSSIVDNKKPPVDNKKPPASNNNNNDLTPLTTTTADSRAIHDKQPPCDVPRGIEEESCPPSPLPLRLHLPQAYSDPEATTSPSSDGSARPSLLTPHHQSMALTGDELLSSISSPGGVSEESFTSRLHIEHIMANRSSQALPYSPIDEPVVDVHQSKPLPNAPPQELPPSQFDSSPEPSPIIKTSRFTENVGQEHSHAEAPESPIVRNLREFSRLYNSNLALFGTHSRTRSVPVNDFDDLPTPRIRPGRPQPLDSVHTRSMVEVLPPVPKTPPPVPRTPEGHSLSRQNSMKTLPSQLRYQLSKGSLRRPVPPHRVLPPLANLEDRPRPQTEFHVEQGLGRDPRIGATPYTSPPGQTHFPIPMTIPTPLMEQDEHSAESAYPKELQVPPFPMNQSHRGPSTPSVFSEVSMTHSDPDREARGNMMGGDDDEDYDDDAQSYMSNPLDGMRSPISPDETIYLDGRPRPRRDGNATPQPTSFFDLGFDMDIGRLQKRSRWKFWSKITRHHKKSK